MDLSFLGATRTVTGSSFLLAVGDRRVMVDCGLYQGLPQLQERNYTHPAVDWSEIDAILLTHAHIDHCGLIPRAVRLGFKGPIYAHAATIDLAEVMLKDSAEIHERDSEWLNRKRKRAGKQRVEPLFERVDVEKSFDLFRSVPYGNKFEVVPGVNAEFRDAGHILGAASIAVDCKEGDLERRIVFSGDIGHHNAPILREPVGFEKADAVLIETTYGARLHESTEGRRAILKEIIDDAYSNRAKVVIPAFTVGRTQELLYILGDMIDDGTIPAIKIFLDSPMAIAATRIHDNHPECFDRETLDRISAGENPFYPETLSLSNTVSDSRKINRFEDAAIIIAGGGMCEGGRIVHHLKHTLYDSRNHLLFVGYQAEGTLGRVILNGTKKLRLFGEEIAVNARVTPITAFSAHADRDGLVDWLSKYKDPPQVVFTVHGEEQSSKDFGNTIREELGFEAYLPKLGQRVDLSQLEQLTVKHREFVPSRTPTATDVREIISRVAMLGGEFQSTIENYIGELGQRIRQAHETGRDPHWKTQDVTEILEHMSGMVGGDIDKLESLRKETDTVDGESGVQD